MNLKRPQSSKFEINVAALSAQTLNFMQMLLSAYEVHTVYAPADTKQKAFHSNNFVAFTIISFHFEFEACHTGIMRT